MRKLGVWKATLLLLVSVGKAPSAESVVELAKQLRDRDDTVRITAEQKLLQATPDQIATIVPILSEGLGEESENVRYSCSEILRRCGSKAKLAIPALVECLNKDEDHGGTRHNVAVTLVAIGEATVPELVKNLRKARGWSWRIRFQTIEVLADIGPPAKGALSELAVEADNCLFPDVRLEAAHAIVSIAHDDSEALKVAVPILIGALERERKDQALRAAESLSRTGKNGKPAVPLLLKILQDAPEHYGLPSKGAYNCRAAFAIWRLGSDAKDAGPALNKMLQEWANYDDEGIMPTLVAAALLRMEPANQKAAAVLQKSIPLLISDLADANSGIPVFAAETLGRLGSKAKIALPALKKAAQEPDKELRAAASRAIKSIEESGRP